MFALATWQATELERKSPYRTRGGAGFLIYLPTAYQARLMSLGFVTVAADYYWVKALQYFADPTFAHVNYKNLPDFLDLVIGLDPDFQYAYKFAGIAVPFNYERLKWANTHRSTRILEKGVERFPDDWQLRFLLGFNYLNFHNRPADAADQFAKAAALPGAPTYLNAFATRVYNEGGALDRAIAFAKDVLASTSDPEIRTMMEARLQELLVEQELQRLEAAAKDYKERKGRFPVNLTELFAETWMDPAPPGFWLDDKGQAHAPKQMRRLRLFENIHDGQYVVKD
ncbi:MAG: hypothetical protein ACK4N5_05990 [Myxococcales bacterium]